MPVERTELGRGIETGLGDVLAHIAGKTELPCRIVVCVRSDCLGEFRRRLPDLLPARCSTAAVRRRG